MDKLNEEEKVVLQNPDVRRDYNKLIKEAKYLEAKSFLKFQVNLKRIHDQGSKFKDSLDGLFDTDSGNESDGGDTVVATDEPNQETDPLLRQPEPRDENSKEKETPAPPEPVAPPPPDPEAKPEKTEEIPLKPDNQGQKKKKDTGPFSSAKRNHIFKLFLFLLFNVILLSVDIITDFFTAIDFLQRDKLQWGLMTLIPIFAPMFVRVSVTLFNLIKAKVKKDEPRFEVQLKALPQIVWHIPFLRPISNLRTFFGLLMLDPSLPINSTLIFLIKKEVITSGVFEAFLESAPQFILQASIVLRTGNITLAQCISMPISFLSLANSSVKLFYSQRLGRYPEVDPSVKMVLLVFPFIALQLVGPLLSLILMATYFGLYLLIFIALLIFVHYFVIKFILFGRKSFPNIVDLYQRSPSRPISVQLTEQSKDESESMFITAIFTSWISPCTVWINSFKTKSYFLLASSTTSTILHMLSIGSIYLYIYLLVIPSTDNPPLIHCFGNESLTSANENFSMGNETLWSGNETLWSGNETLESENETLWSGNETVESENETLESENGGMIPEYGALLSEDGSAFPSYDTLLSENEIMFSENKVSDSEADNNIIGTGFSLSNINICYYEDACLPVIRMCSDSEDQSFEFFYIFGPTILITLLLSFIFSICVHFLSDYLTMFNLSRMLCCCCKPIFHKSLLNDILRFEPRERIQVMLDKAIEIDPTIVNQRDPLHGDTSLHTALENRLLHILDQMVLKEGDPSLNNNYHESVFHQLKQKIEASNDPVEKEEMYKILEKMKPGSVIQQDRENSTVNVWREQPMLKHARQNNPGILCFLNILGGHWSVENKESKNAIRVLADQMETCQVNFSTRSAFVKWWIPKGMDQYGQTIMHISAWNNMSKCLDMLLKAKADANVKRTQDGWAPLHYAVKYNYTECARILISNGANVNAQTFTRETPLHVAVNYGAFECARLLIQHHADVNARSELHWTPVHVAAYYGHEDCLKLLIESKPEINPKNLNNSTPLHAALKATYPVEQKERICEILINAGADLKAKGKSGETPMDDPLLKELKLKKPNLFSK